MKKSVIIRGKIFPYTQETINSIRTWYDGEIILSTWEKEKTNHLYGYDSLIRSEDPGPGPVQQLKRQLITYNNALQKTSADLLLITRSDMVHKENMFKFFKTCNKKNEVFRIFQEKIVIGNIMTIHPNRTCPGETERERYFRVNDWFQVGLRQDLVKWGSTLDIVDNVACKNISSEQFWLGGSIKKYYDDSFDLNKIQNYKNFSLLSILNNFRIFNTNSTLKTYNQKYKNQPENLICYFTEQEYEKECEKIFGHLK